MESRSNLPVTLPHPSPLPSYWHNPPSPLATHIHSPTLPAKCTYLIIGSGITGTLIAHNLLSQDPSANIVMLEARTACSGATGRNGGHTKAASYRTYLANREELCVDEAKGIARCEFENIMTMHELVRREGIEEVAESTVCKTVDIVYDEQTFEEGKRNIEILRADAEPHERGEDGWAWYRIHSAAEAREKFYVGETNTNPNVKQEEKLVGAFEYLAGRMNAYRFATAILEKCVARGLELYTNTPATKLLPSSSPSGDGVQHTVLTLRGPITASNVIFATNGYTAHLLPELHTKIVPLRGQITAQRPGRKSVLPSPLETTYSFIYKEGYEYMIPRPVGDGSQHIIIGGGLGRLPEAGASEYGTCDDSVLNDVNSKYLRETCVGYFGRGNWGEIDEEEAGERIVSEWTGIMGVTGDGRPFVGGFPGMEGVWICAGFNGHGMVLCLKSAEALVQLMSGKTPQDIDWFPSSFLITKDRLETKFGGRRDLSISEPVVSERDS